MHEKLAKKFPSPKQIADRLIREQSIRSMNITNVNLEGQDLPSM